MRTGLRAFPRCAPRMIVMTLEANERGRTFYKKMGGNFRGIYGGYPVGGDMYDVAVFEWLDVPIWIDTWEEKYGKEEEDTRKI